NFSNNFYAVIPNSNSLNLSDNFSISLWFKNSNNDFPLVNWSSPNFSLGVRSQTPRLTQNQNLDCSLSIESAYCNHLGVTVNDAQQKIFLNGNDCGTKNESGPFNYNNPLIRIGWDGGSSYTNGAIDELKFFNQVLEIGEVKKLFINTGRSLEGYYPLGNKIVSGSVRDLSGNNFHGRIRDQNKNIVTSITAQQNYEKKSNRSSYFGRDRFVEVDYQAKLNPSKFSLVGWIKPNNSLDTMEGILSSECSNGSNCSTTMNNQSSMGNSGQGYGLYRWIYRSYKLKTDTSYNTTVRSSQKLVNRNGSELDSAQGQGNCIQIRYTPPLPLSSGPDKCDSVNSNGNCNDKDYKHTYAWSPFGPYENQTTITCREVDSINRLFEFWTRPSAGTFDTSGTGLYKNNSSKGFIEQTGYDTNQVAKILRSYDRTNADDSAIQQSKLNLSGGATQTFPYKIEEKDVNNWIMFIARWDGTHQKIQLRNYFDVVNDPGVGNSPAKNSTYNPVTNPSSKLYIGNGYGDGRGYPGDYKLNLFQGNIDDVRIYSRVISEDEIKTIFNLSDSEPPVPGNQGTITKSGSCSLSWSAAEDDVTSTSNLEYKVVGITSSNRISTVESALVNDTLNNNWSQSTTANVVGLGGGFVNILVKDEGGNMSLYDGASCP
ncbi:MAG: LamG domain-containing protein, partial [SAR324 cluster bacterium]|nr:LamG domain-containing protein [SAR324 cluster bacterium]